MKAKEEKAQAWTQRKMAKKQNINKPKKINKPKMNSTIKEIIWNLVNSLLAGCLVMLGAFSTGNISWQSFCIAIIAGFVVAINQFKDYWGFEKDEYCGKRVGAFL